MSAGEDYSAGLLENSHNKKPTHSQVVKEVINWFYGPDAGKFSKEWSKRLLRPRPRLTQALSTTTPEYVTYDTANYPVLLGPSARIPYHVIILGGVLILAVFYLLLFLVISRLRCCRKVNQLLHIFFNWEFHHFKNIRHCYRINSERLAGGAGRLGGKPMDCITLKEMCWAVVMSILLRPNWVKQTIRHLRLMKTL